MQSTDVEVWQRSVRDAQVHLARGEYELADRYAQKALARSPNSVAALRISGVARIQMGRPNTAVANLEKAVGLDPSSPFVRCDLAMALMGIREFAKAEAQFLLAIKLKPDFAEALYNLGNLYNRYINRDKAEKCYRRAITIRPNFAEALTELALLQFDQGFIDLAEALCNEAIKAAPRSAAARSLRGRVLDSRGKLDEAVASLELAISLDAGGTRCFENLAQVYRAHGRKSEAIKVLERAVRTVPEDPRLRRLLFDVSGSVPSEEELNSMEGRLNNRTMAVEDRIELGFCMGAAYERQQSFAQAFAYYAEANKLHRSLNDYPRTQTMADFDEVMAAFKTEFFERIGSSGSLGNNIIFIVGMPRSGTSLAEQILSAHPEISAGGETLLLNRYASNTFWFDRPPSFVRMTRDATASRLQDFATGYLQELRARSRGKRYITEKLPQNFMFLGLIAAALPGAKIIHCRRSPADTCWSMFRQLFSGRSLSFAYDLRELGEYYRRYQELMSHWSTVLPIPIHDLHLEKLVKEQREETQKLLEFLELPWAESCLDFQGAQHAVHTASVDQVRQPLTDRSIGIAAKYGDALKPLYRALAAA